MILLRTMLIAIASGLSALAVSADQRVTRPDADSMHPPTGRLSDAVPTMKPNGADAARQENAGAEQSGIATEDSSEFYGGAEGQAAGPAEDQRAGTDVNGTAASPSKPDGVYTLPPTARMSQAVPTMKPDEPHQAIDATPGVTEYYGKGKRSAQKSKSALKSIRSDESSRSIR